MKYSTSFVLLFLIVAFIIPIFQSFQYNTVLHTPSSSNRHALKTPIKSTKHRDDRKFYLEALVPRDDPSLFAPKFQYDFNSTTVKAIVEIKDNFMSWIASVENSILSFRVAIATKVERDIRLTFGATDYVTRRAASDLSAISETLQQLTNSPSSLFTLPSSGSASQSPRMLASLVPKSTKEKARALRNDVVSPQKLLSDNLALRTARQMRTLPKEMQYSYQLRRIRNAQGAVPADASALFRQLPGAATLRPRQKSSQPTLQIPPASKVVFEDNSVVSNELIYEKEWLPTSESESEAPSLFAEPSETLVVSADQLQDWQVLTRVLMSEQAATRLFDLCSGMNGDTLQQLQEATQRLRSDAKLRISASLVSTIQSHLQSLLAQITVDVDEDIEDIQRLERLFYRVSCSFPVSSVYSVLVFDSPTSCLSYAGSATDSSSADSSIGDVMELETTAETIGLAGNSLSQQRLATLLQVIDVVFFLLEVLAKSIWPLLRDGGATLVSRASEVYSPKLSQLSRRVYVGRDAQRWQLYNQLNRDPKPVSSEIPVN